MSENKRRAHLLSYLNQGIRFDGRKLDEYRKVEVEMGAINNAHGSAKVKIGNTEVLVGIKMEIGSPYPDQPNKGTMMFGVELLPMSNPKFEPGPPSEFAIELARVIDRGIRESEALDTAKLCIKEGEKIWMVVVDICPLNDEGNLFDAGSLGSIAAIKNCKLPKFDDNYAVLHKEPSEEGLPINHQPIEVTVIKIDKHLLIDPTIEEMEYMDARLTAAFTEDGTICALQKGGEAPLSPEVIDEMVVLAGKKSEELRKYI